MAIQILPARLANQIAAGEVVERPASVVKELVENSIDAGATCIDIDIEKGGSKLIRIRDNGFGIPKDELTLALSRHATSKISSLDDLEAITSLGFRGEALASISSVSRLTMTSRTETQSEAWAAYAEGRDMQVSIKPAAHPVGTSVEVVDLFFNTPARRKFLRTDKTEFGHIDELIKRIALSRFDVSINLSHNGVRVRQYRSAKTQLQKEKRLAAICGRTFVENMVSVELEHCGLSLHGWICLPKGARAQNDIQHCFVNQRMMKDKLINHAIRQGYETLLSSEQFATFVLYLQIDPDQVDVNVHPAKHEVRFHQARFVHDFIYQAVADALVQSKGFCLDGIEEGKGHYVLASQPEKVSYFNDCAAFSSERRGVARGYTGHSSSKNDHSWRQSSRYSTLPPTSVSQDIYAKLIQIERLDEDDAAEFDPPFSHQDSEMTALPARLGKPLAVLEKKYLLLQDNQKIYLLDLEFASYLEALGQIKAYDDENGVQKQPLLLPLQLKLSPQEIDVLLQHELLLLKFGISIKQKSANQVMLMTVCQLMRKANMQDVVFKICQFLLEEKVDAQTFAHWLARTLMHMSDEYQLSQSILLISALENCWQEKLAAYYAQLLRPLDFTSVIEAFNYE